MKAWPRCIHRMQENGCALRVLALRNDTVLPQRTVYAALVVLLTACNDHPAPQVPPDQSRLKAATDVFWALDKQGYVVGKEKPQPSRHGCKPSEYLAKKVDATFRISVFHCGDAEQAKALVEHPKTRLVNSLLRNHGEGGILRRGPLQIIVRMTQGDKQAARELLRTLEAL